MAEGLIDEERNTGEREHDEEQDDRALGRKTFVRLSQRLNDLWEAMKFYNVILRQSRGIHGCKLEVLWIFTITLLCLLTKYFKYTQKKMTRLRKRYTSLDFPWKN